ncbi:hypothetical protein MTR62_02700 [Novosphingobium sp. 1949]|uniref:Uncharacterized protein n=1 Tax=Novosphingobium organovorum TaxID=2930092 RepID=A0ABT0B9T9_9SPHN|nr:hypothetical protein [Novosphingobium organovorum]MCJ2181623.1 hypothetical protein [Novosphingobium organovorum]
MNALQRLPVGHRRSAHLRLPGPLAIQAMIALCVLLAALSPVAGGAALYLPLGATRPAQTIAWSRAHGASLIGPGPTAGSFYVRVPSGPLFAAALRDGAVLLAVPEALCGAPDPQQTAKPS